MSLSLEDLQPDRAVKGIRPNETTVVVGTKWHGTDSLTLLYRDNSGKVRETLLFREDENRLSFETQGSPWTFDGDGGVFRLAAEAQRITTGAFIRSDSRYSYFSDRSPPTPNNRRL